MFFLNQDFLLSSFFQCVHVAVVHTELTVHIKVLGVETVSAHFI